MCRLWRDWPVLWPSKLLVVHDDCHQRLVHAHVPLHLQDRQTLVEVPRLVRSFRRGMLWLIPAH